MMSGRRSPSNIVTRPSGKQPAQQPQQKKIPADLVTYRLNDEMVYVEPAKDYNQALEFARSVFPTLASLPHTRVAFLVNVRVNGSLRKVRIAPMAWPRVMKSLATYEIIDLTILPEPPTLLYPYPNNNNINTCTPPTDAAMTARAAKSESELALATSSYTYQNGGTIDKDNNEMPPPKYGSTSDLLYSSMGYSGYRDSEKSPYFTLQTSDAERLSPPPPPSPSVKRCTSAFSWFTRHF